MNRIKIEFNEIYYDKVTLNIAEFSEREINKLLQDGRFSNFIQSKLIPKLFQVTEDEVIVKTFTSHGTTVRPSKQLGIKRIHNTPETVDHIASERMWCFVNVINAPYISIVFKKPHDVLGMFEKNISKDKGKFRNFPYIVMFGKKGQSRNNPIVIE